jgi:O-antigen/teichoic acid export membrane protein
MGWTPYFLRRGKEEGAENDFARATKYFLGISGFFMVLLTIWVNDLIHLKIGGVSIIGESFWDSTAIIPVILLGYYFFGFYVLQLPGIYLKDKTKWVPVFRAVGAGSNIALNIALIPEFGALGAAWATATAHLIMAMVIYLKSKSVYHVPVNLIGLALPLIFMIGICWLPETFTMKIMVTLLFPAAWLLLVADQNDRKLLFGKNQ